jgi:hypothetical protein
MREIDVLVLRNVVGMLVVLLHAPRVPFIAPKQLGAVESNQGRLILPSVGWCTGQSGAHRTVRCTPDTVRCPISFHNWRSRPLAAREPLAHRTCPVHTGQSGAFF